MPMAKLQRKNASMAKRLLRKYATQTTSAPPTSSSSMTEVPVVPILRQELVSIMDSRVDQWYQIITDTCKALGFPSTPMPSRDTLVQEMRNWIQESNQQVHFSATTLAVENDNADLKCDSVQTRMFVDKVCSCVLTIAGEQLQDESELWRMYAWQSLAWINLCKSQKHCTALLTAMIHAEWLLRFVKRPGGRTLALDEMRGDLLAFRG